MIGYTGSFCAGWFALPQCVSYRFKSFLLYETHNLIVVCSMRANFRLYEHFPFAKQSINKKGGKGEPIFVLGVFAL